MYLLVLILGSILGIILYKKVPVWLHHYKPVFFPPRKTYEIQFRLTWLSQPSIFTTDLNGDLVKTKPITVRITADSEHDALMYLNELILQETKPDLIAIKEADEQVQVNN
jgi:hypothetical protein